MVPFLDPYKDRGDRQGATCQALIQMLEEGKVMKRSCLPDWDEAPVLLEHFHNPTGTGVLRLLVAMLAGNGLCRSGLSRTLQRSAPVGRVGDR